MNNVVLPFLMSMLLGRTIDLTSYSISGINVFDDTHFDETRVGTLQTTYNVLQEDAFPYTFFGIPADVVLRIKANFLSSLSGAMGLDGVLKDTTWKYNSVVVSATTVYRTVDRTLKPDAPQLKDWSDKISSSQTHYARSLFYGGWYVVLFRFHCDVPSDVNVVRKILTEHLGVVGVLCNDTVDSWNRSIQDIKKNKDIRGSVKVTVHVYSTTPLVDYISSPETLLKAIDALPDVVGNLGQPLYMELKPLHDLNERYPVVKENNEMLGELEKLDEMFDDVKLTKASAMKWMAETLAAFDDEQEEKISTMLYKLNECIKAFSKFSGEVSLFKKVNRDDLDAAFHTYLGGLERGAGTYNLAFRRLKEEVDAECDDDFHGKIRGLLRVYDDDVQQKGEVEGGIEGCQALCIADQKCRAIGFAEKMDELDLDTGSYLKKENQCWIYFRSTGTALVHTPNGLSGDIGVYDRKCY